MWHTKCIISLILLIMLCNSVVYSFRGKSVSRIVARNIGEKLQQRVTKRISEIVDEVVDEKALKKQKNRIQKEEEEKHFSNRLISDQPLLFVQEGVNFTIFGAPVALQRHRLSRFSTIYNPSAGLQNSFRKAALPYLSGPPHEGPLAMKLDFYMPRLKSHYGTGKKESILKSDAPHWHSKKPGRLRALSPIPISYTCLCSQFYRC